MISTSYSDVAVVLDLDVKGGEAAAVGKCAFCQGNGETVQCNYMAAEVWLHRDCIDAWTVAYDNNLDAQSDLDRRKAFS
jgi:hypothetical protein